MLEDYFKIKKEENKIILKTPFNTKIEIDLKDYLIKGDYIEEQFFNYKNNIFQELSNIINLREFLIKSSFNSQLIDKYKDIYKSNDEKEQKQITDFLIKNLYENLDASKPIENIIKGLNYSITNLIKIDESSKNLFEKILDSITLSEKEFHKIKDYIKNIKIDIYNYINYSILLNIMDDFFYNSILPIKEKELDKMTNYINNSKNILNNSINDIKDSLLIFLKEMIISNKFNLIKESLKQIIEIYNVEKLLNQEDDFYNSLIVDEIFTS